MQYKPEEFHKKSFRTPQRQITQSFAIFARNKAAFPAARARALRAMILAQFGNGLGINCLALH
jgi:hypothetical protein